MKPEKQRIAIAKACGKKVREITYNRGTPRLATSWVSETNEPIPDYLNDLNAMHEAEKHIKTNCDMQRYLDKLRVICRCVAHGEGTIMATAAERAEAFLKTIGRWEE